MWRKICKEELRETRKVYFVMFAILLAAGIISLVVMRQTALYPGDTFGGTPEEFDVRSVLSIGSILGMYVLWIAAMVVYVVYTLYRFDRGVFGGEGVFWMTLPVKRREILAGKLLAPLVWGAGLVLLGIVWLALMLFMQDPYGSTSFSMDGMAVGIGMVAFMVLSQILMAVGSLYALCFALMAGRLPRFQKHPYLWGGSCCAGDFLHHRAAVQCAGYGGFRCSCRLFPYGDAVPHDKRHCSVWFHCIDSHCYGIADTDLWGTDGVSGRKEIGLFRLRKVIPCSLITVYPFICRS